MTLSCTRLTCRPTKPCAACARTAAEAARSEHASWFQRTGHCGGCGQPAEVCVCTERHPCGCRHLHPMGVGLNTDITEVFAAPAISDQQGELFTP